MELVSRYVWLTVAVSFMSVNNLECSAVQDFPQLDHVTTKYVCQNDSINISCPSPSLLEIQAASFGRGMTVICAGGANADRPCEILDKKLIVKQLCDYKPECTFVANAENFGNHCPDIDKYLNIIFACVRNPDVEYFKTEPTTIESPSTSPTQAPKITMNNTTPTIQPLAFNVTFPSNVTQAPNTTINNTSMNNTTPTIRPWTAPNKPRKKSEVPEDKIRYFNPDGPALDFLAKGGQISIFQVKDHTHVIVLSGLGTLISLFQWFL